MSQSEQELLLGLINGDKYSILSFYKTTLPKVIGFVKRNNGTKEDAEDIFHKALMQIIARYKLKSFKIKTSLNAYIFTACKNLWRRELKRKKEVTNNHKYELVSKERDFAMLTLEMEQYELYKEKFNDLSENCRKILTLVFGKTPYKDILPKFEYASENVLRQRVFKCKKKLIELIKNDSRFNSLKNI